MEVQPAIVERVFSPKQKLNVNLLGSYTVTYFDIKPETTSLVIKCMLWSTPLLGSPLGGLQFPTATWLSETLGSFME